MDDDGPGHDNFSKDRDRVNWMDLSSIIEMLPMRLDSM